MSSDELIRALSRDLTPVHRLRRVGSRALLWSVFAVTGVFVGAGVLGIRADLATRLRDPSFLLECALLLVAFAVSGRSAFRSSVPGGEHGRSGREAPLFLLLAWFLLVVVAHPIGAGDRSDLAGLSCVWKMLWLALTPGAGLVFMLRRAAPLESRYTGLVALLAASSLAMLGTRLICSRDAPLHLLLWHFAPVIVAGFAGLVVGDRLLRGGAR